MRVASPVPVIAITVTIAIAVLGPVVVRSLGQPARVLPNSNAVAASVPQSVEVRSEGCLAPMTAEQKKRPGWVIRIDDMRWTDYTHDDDDPKYAQLVIDADGATWQSMVMPTQTLPLTDEERKAVFAAFNLRCARDESRPNDSWFEGRYISVAYDRAGKAAAKIEYNSPATMRFGEQFELIRARYVASRAAAAKSYVLKLRRQRRGNPEVFDISKYDLTDEDRVDFFDWLLTLPVDLLPGGAGTSGTLTIDGTTRPIALEDVELFRHSGAVTSELRFWIMFGGDALRYRQSLMSNR